MELKDKSKLTIKEVEKLLDESQIEELLKYIDFRTSLVANFNNYPRNMKKISFDERVNFYLVIKDDKQYNVTKTYKLETMIINNSVALPRFTEVVYIVNDEFISCDNKVCDSMALILSYAFKALNKEYPNVEELSMKNPIDYSNKCKLELELINRAIQLVIPYKNILPVALDEKKWTIRDAYLYGKEEMELLRNYLINSYANKYDVSEKLVSDLFKNVVNESFMSKILNYPGFTELLTGNYHYEDSEKNKTRKVK